MTVRYGRINLYLGTFPDGAGSVWATTTDLLGQGLVDLVNVFDPDVVVLGGGVTRAGELLLGPVRNVVRADVLGPAARRVVITTAELGEAVGVVGAAAARERARPSPSGCELRKGGVPCRTG